MMSITAAPALARRASLATAAALCVGGLVAGCNSFSSSTPASLAAEPVAPGDFTGTTQPVRNYPPSVAFYQNGDTKSGSTGVRWVSGLGYETGEIGQTGPAGGYGYVGANNAAGGAGGASGSPGTGLAGSSDTGFTAGSVGNATGGTGLAGTSAAPSGNVAVTGANGSGTNGLGTGGTSGTGVTGTGVTGASANPAGVTITSSGGSTAAQANQTAAANAANANAGTIAQTGGSGVINDRGTVTNANTINNANDAAAISGSNVTSGAGAAPGSGTGTGTIGGTDVTGRTGIDPSGIRTSNANVNTNSVGGVSVASGTGNPVGTAAGGQTGNGQAAVEGEGAQPSFGDQASTAGLVATTPIYGTGLVIANAITSPYTLIEQRNGIVSSGVQFPPTYTAMPALPRSPSNSPVYRQDQVVPIRGTTPGVAPTTVPISGDTRTGSPTTMPVQPAILTPVEQGTISDTAFTIAGDVQFPNRYETGTNVKISQAIAGAGLNSAADPAKVKFRLARTGNQPADASLADLQSGKVDDIVLKPGDVLTVTMLPQAIATVERPTTAPSTGPLRAAPTRR